MGKRHWVATAALMAATLLAGTAATAGPSVYVQVAPPAPQYEVAPPPRHGQVWVPGHWEWRRHRYVWVGGYYVAARPGYYYEPAVWVQDGGRWAYNGGRWARGHRDSDRDGVPDRYDRQPHNPYRR